LLFQDAGRAARLVFANETNLSIKYSFQNNKALRIGGGQLDRSAIRLETIFAIGLPTIIPEHDEAVLFLVITDPCLRIVGDRLGDLSHAGAHLVSCRFSVVANALQRVVERLPSELVRRLWSTRTKFDVGVLS